MTTERAGKAADDRRLLAADHWFGIHRSGSSLSPAAFREWDRWISDPDNRAEYDELAVLNERLRRLPPPPLPSVSELKADSAYMPDDLDSATESLSEVQLVPTAAFMQAQRRRLMLGAIAIAIMLCCFGVLVHLWLSYPPSNPPIDSGRVYETKLGEQRRVELDEGSMITMRGDTRLRVRFVMHFRVAILERGEALFKVTPDPERPFRVFAGNGSVDAIGTEFDVRRYAEHIRVEVTDGVVHVATRARPIPGIETDAHPSHVAQSMAVRLKRGEEITYEMDGSASAPQFINIERVAERMAGFFVFEDQPLHQVIDEVQPDFPRQITLDATVARIRYHGSIKKETIEQWVRALPDLYPVEVLDSGPNSIEIRAKR